MHKVKTRHFYFRHIRYGLIARAIESTVNSRAESNRPLVGDRGTKLLETTTIWFCSDVEKSAIR